MASAVGCICCWVRLLVGCKLKGLGIAAVPAARGRMEHPRPHLARAHRALQPGPLH